MAKKAGLQLKDFLLLKGMEEQDVEAFLDLHKLVLEVPPFLNSDSKVETTNGTGKLEIKIFCPICNSEFKKQDGKFDSDGILNLFTMFYEKV